MSIQLTDLPNLLRRLASGARGAGTTLSIEDREITFPNAQTIAALLKHFGFAHSQAELYPISREDAAALIAHLVAYDQAYGRPTNALAIGDDCGDQFVGMFPPEARFFTNSRDRIDASARSWASLTDATFDCGVVGIAPTRVGTIWFEDED